MATAPWITIEESEISADAEPLMVKSVPEFKVATVLLSNKAFELCVTDTAPEFTVKVLSVKVPWPVVEDK